MARAPNPGAPQRVSAHVLPKASSFPNEEEEERTSIENGAWEEEISTTVEQGEVAAKLRGLVLGGDGRRPNTNITATNGSGVTEDPTMDDQRAAGLAMSQPGSARLLVTHGNDTGRALEVRPGKEYTVGRGIDNDLVLTDITASRKHFDLRFEGGMWVLADRGSGNGTLINNRIEDAPFVLATGDTIEVGNTAFRFEAIGVARGAGPGGAGARDGGGRAGRLPTDESAPHDPPSPSVAVPPPVGLEMVGPRGSADGSALDAAGLPRDRPGARGSYDEADSASRPAGMQSAALRPRSSSVRSAGAGSADRSGAVPGPVPLSSAPIAAVSPPSGAMQTGPLAPQPATAVSPSQTAARGAALLDPSHGPLPTTLPGPGAPGAAGRAPRMLFGVPPGAEQSAQIVSGIRPPLNVAPGNPPRDATSTALVQPMSYSDRPAPAAPPPAYRMIPPLSRRVVLGAVGLAVFATVATVAIIKSLSGDALDRGVATSSPGAASHARSPAATAPSVAPEVPGEPRVRSPGPVVAAAGEPRAGTERAGGAGSAGSSSEPRGNGASPSPAAGTSPPPQATAASAARPGGAAIASASAAPDGTSGAAPPIVAVRPPPPSPRTPAPRAPVIDRRPIKRLETRSMPRKVAEQAPVRPDKKRGRSMAEVKSEASALYRSKNFGAAAQTLTSSTSGFSGEDAKELKNLASIYAQLGKNYSIGMAPGTKPTDAYVALNRALEFDKDVGAAFVSEIREKLAGTASRAAALYMASKEYEQAFQAVRLAEQLRSTSPTNKVVRESLANVADELLRGARAEQSSSPEAARQKLRQILGIVEPRSAAYAQAQKLLSAL